MKVFSLKHADSAKAAYPRYLWISLWRKPVSLATYGGIYGFLTLWLKIRQKSYLFVFIHEIRCQSCYDCGSVIFMGHFRLQASYEMPLCTTEGRESCTAKFITLYKQTIRN
jgi:hypothetical protein